MVKFLCSNLRNFSTVIFDTRDLALSCNRIFFWVFHLFINEDCFFIAFAYNASIFLPSFFFFLFIQISLSPFMIQSLLLNEFLIRYSYFIHIFFFYLSSISLIWHSSKDKAIFKKSYESKFHLPQNSRILISRWCN